MARELTKDEFLHLIGEFEQNKVTKGAIRFYKAALDAFSYKSFYDKVECANFVYDSGQVPISVEIRLKRSDSIVDIILFYGISKAILQYSGQRDAELEKTTKKILEGRRFKLF